MKKELWTPKDEMHFKMGDMHGEVFIQKPEKPVGPVPTKPPKIIIKYKPQKR